LPTASQVKAAKELLARRKGRLEFADFCRYVASEEPPSKHHLLICDIADRIIDGSCKRAMFLMPPGSAKSTYATVRFPAYYLGRLKRKGVICASYNDTLASQFGKKTRNLIRQTETQTLFPGLSLSSDSQAKGEWDTEDGGFYFAVGIGGGVTGRRADLGVIDDPIRGRKDADSQLIRDNCWNWYLDDFRTRLKPGAAIILIQTRWHEDDLAGRILSDDWSGESGKVVAKDGEEWEVVCLPAQAGENDILGREEGEWLWTEWFSEEWWLQTKHTVTQFGYRSWNSLYQQIPTDDEGSFFKREWFNRFELSGAPRTTNYQSTDFATKEDEGDYTELGIFGMDQKKELYILDWWYKQATTDVWIDRQLDQYKSYNCFASFGETGPIRRAVEPFQTMRSRQRQIYPRFEWIVRTGDKAAMARSFQGMASAGMIHIPNTDWGDRLISQLCKFPNGKHDDAVDVCALMAMAIQSAHPAIVNINEPQKADRDAYGWADDDDGDSWRIA
jgi:predicted phage terminase large subunit-like protein